MSEYNTIPITIDTGDNINVDLESSINVVTSGSYIDVTDKPSINNVELIGNKSLEDLGIIIPDVQSAIAQHNTSATAHTDIRNAITTEVTNRENADNSLQEQIDALVIPDKTSDLTNDSGFITRSDLSGYATLNDIPSNVSELTNDSGYQNATQVSTSISSALSGYATETWVQNYIASLDATNTRY